MFKKKPKMSEEDFQRLQYPVGKFEAPDSVSTEQLEQWIVEVGELPYQVRKAVAGMRQKDLDSTYRPDGWTGRQVINHLADSHINAFVRFKWALTENVPMIKPYDEVAWAELKDSNQMSVEVSIRLLDALHQRWVYLLRHLKKKHWQKAFDHPDYEKPATLDYALGMYAWHGRHHVGHLKIIRDRLKF